MALFSFSSHSSATSLAKGSLGFGAANNAWTDNKIVLICKAGDQLSSYVSTLYLNQANKHVNTHFSTHQDIFFLIYQYLDDRSLSRISLLVQSLDFMLVCCGFPLTALI